MARDGSGTYTNPYPNFVSGTVISSTEVDTNNSQIATALTQSIAVDGQAVVTADLPLATHKFTGMKVGTASTDSLSLGQAQAEAFVWCGTAGGGADAITLSPSPAITAYAAGQRFVWMAGSLTNTTATTVAISGLAAIALQDNGAALTAGQHAASKMFMGILNTTSTVQIMQVQVSGTDPLIVSSLTVTGDATIGDDLTLLSDASILGFGEHTDVTVTHVADSGLTLKNTSTDDDTPFVLLVQTGEIDIALDDALGKIQFQAPDEGAGTDAILVAAEIAAISEGDFSSSNNATKLSFKTAASGATSEKMSISSVGNVTMKETETGDDTPMTLLLQTGETDIVAADVLGKIQFQAPDEAGGTDAILVAAEVAAISEGTFAADNNATKLSFLTAASGAVSEKMSISSAGVVTLSAATEATGTGTAALAVTGGLGVAKDVWIGDDLVLDSDAAVISFGDNQDVLLTHVADTGLTMSVTGNNIAQLGVVQDKDDAATGPVFNLTRYSTGSPGPEDNDGGGIIQFVMENDNNQLFTAAQIYTVAVDVADGTEDGKLIINTMKNGTATAALTISELGTATFGGNIVIPDDGTIGSASDTDAIAIRSDGNVGIRNAGNSAISLQVTGTGTDTVIQGASGGHGLDGRAGTSAAYVGTMGFAFDTAHYGYLGYSTIGLYATSITTPGVLSKGSGSFRIPHGLREDYDLIHSFIEGPQCDLIYRGRATLVDGQATVSMDTKYEMTAGTFEWLTKADDVQTFTSNETGWDAVKSSFSGDTITIECQNADSTDTISWMVVAERGDPNIISSTLTDDEGNLIIERPSEPEPPLPSDFEPPPED